MINMAGITDANNENNKMIDYRNFGEAPYDQLTWKTPTRTRKDSVVV